MEVGNATLQRLSTLRHTISGKEAAMRVKKRWLFCGLSLLTLALLVGQTFAPKYSCAADDPSKRDWRVFRGNVEQTGVATAALPDKLQELWKFSTKDSIEGAPAIA